jgi:hypothetical protein
MKKEILAKCAIIGGVVLFVWGMISWTLIPWHKLTMHRFDDQQKVANVIQNNTSVSGVYILPNMHSDENDDSDIEMGKSMMRNGPIAFVSVNKEGITRGAMTLSFIIGFIIQVIAVAIATHLLMQTKGLKYWKQVCFFVLMGIFAWVVTTASAWNWHALSCGYALVALADLVIGWFLAGLVVAELVGKKI